MAWSFGESNPGPCEAGGGAGAGKVQMQDFHFTTRMSKASPKLFLACANGQHMKEAKLVGGQGRRDAAGVPHLDVQRRAREQLPDQRLRRRRRRRWTRSRSTFAKVQVEYKPQKADGSLDKAISGRVGPQGQQEL